MGRSRKLLGLLLARLRAFPRAAQGNMAMIFGLSIIPLVLAAGTGMDYTRAVVARSNMGAALDAAALAVGRQPSKPSNCAAGATDTACTNLKNLAEQYFLANYTYYDAAARAAGLSMTITNQSVVLTTTDNVPTQIVKWIRPSIAINNTTTVVWGQTKLWVSLVLDNTGSMCQSDSNPNAGSPCPNAGSSTKIAALKAATHNLLNMLRSASANPGDVQAAIIPFVKDVNVNRANYTKSWIDWTDWDSINGSCSVSSKHSQSSCTSTHGTWTNGRCNISGITDQSTCTSTHGTWTNGRCNISGYSTSRSCQAATGTWTNGTCSFSGYTTKTDCQNASAVWTPDDHSTWNGCVMDRGTDSGPDSGNYDVMNTAPVSGTPASQFPAEQYSSCPQALTTLSYDWDTLSSEVDSMVANGSTNQPIGLVWGWHALSQSDPLDAPTLPDNTTRYIIILSDGLNTQDRWYGNGSDQSTSVDNRMSAVCANAKADHIIIYAVFVDIGGTQGNSTVLQNCATDASKYYDLTSTSQIANAFNLIGQQITSLRVSR
jgi:Flp pilus assembly protein TadG